MPTATELREAFIEKIARSRKISYNKKELTTLIKEVNLELLEKEVQEDANSKNPV